MGMRGERKCLPDHGAAHRVQNTGPVPLVFVEVQRGDYFGEDDIVRLDDDYGRLRANAPSEDQSV